LFPYVLSRRCPGNAQVCLDDYVEVARHRASTYNRGKLGDLQSTQIKLPRPPPRSMAPRDHAFDLHRDDADARSATSGYRRQDQLRGMGLIPSISVPRRVIAVLGERARGLFTTGALQRQFRDAHAINSPCVQFRCGWHKLWACCALACHPKPDALRPANDRRAKASDQSGSANELARDSSVIDPRDFRHALAPTPRRNVITAAAADGKPYGLTCNSFASVSLNRPSCSGVWGCFRKG